MAGRRRYLNTTISKDALVAQLAKEYGDFAALLYTWMLPHAEDDCSLPLSHEEIRLSVVPGFQKRKTADITKAIEGMLALGLLMKDDTCHYFPPQSFYRHQSYIKEDRRRPSSIVSEQNAANQRKTPQNSEVPRSTAKVAQNAASVPIRSGSDPFPVSVPVSVIEEETRATREPEPEPPPSLPALRKEWENKIGPLSPIGRTRLSYFANSLPFTWIVAAFDETKRKANRPCWEYTEGILQRCLNDDLPPESLREVVAASKASPMKSLRYES